MKGNQWATLIFFTLRTWTDHEIFEDLRFFYNVVNVHTGFLNPVVHPWELIKIVSQGVIFDDCIAKL